MCPSVESAHCRDNREGQAGKENIVAKKWGFWMFCWLGGADFLKIGEFRRAKIKHSPTRVQACFQLLLSDVSVGEECPLQR